MPRVKRPASCGALLFWYDAAMDVLILQGGTSGEREISLRSAAAVGAALQKAGHEVIEYDTQAGFEGILQYDVDAVFPILHGAGGEDGVVQQFLQDHHLPYLGSGPQACRNSFDKAVFTDMLRQAGTPVPDGEAVDAEGFKQSKLADQAFVLKPIDGGSSLDTFIVRDGDRSKVPGGIFTKYPQMLLEELIEGDEITVGVLGDVALPVIEIIPPEDGEFDYENKYNGKTQELCPPQHIDAEVQQRAQELSLKVHRLLGCCHMSRVDIMVDAQGELHVLELNTIPGLTDQSLYPKMAQEYGLSMPELMTTFVELVTGAQKR